MGLIPGWGRSPGKRNSNALQYSFLEDAMTEEPGRLQSLGSQRLYMTEQLSIHTLGFEQLILQIPMHMNIYDQRFLKYLREDCSISPPPLKNNLLFSSPSYDVGPPCAHLFKLKLQKVIIHQASLLTFLQVHQQSRSALPK